MTLPAVATKALTGVTNIDYNGGGSLIKHSGDADHYPTVIMNDFEDPSLTVSCRDLAALNAIPIGSRGTFTATHQDATNGATTGGGAYQLSLLGVVGNHTGGGAHRQFGEGRLDINGESADGVTNPLAFTNV